MEITSFILGVCAVILLLMVAGTSVNYMTFKTLKRDFDNYVSSTERVLADIYRDNEMVRDELHSRITELEQALVRHTDSRVDKLDNKLNGLDDKLMNEVKSLTKEIRTLNREISRVEKGYKEKINY